MIGLRGFGLLNPHYKRQEIFHFREKMEHHPTILFWENYRRT